MNFFFRSPVFPVVLDIGKGLAVAQTPADLKNYLIQYGSTVSDHGRLIDSRYEGFSVIPDRLFVSSLTMKKKYTKKEFLEFCGIEDASLNQTCLDRYSKEDVFMLAVRASKNYRNLKG